VSSGTAFVQTLTPDASSSYFLRTYYAESRNTSSNCVSAFRTPVDGCVSPFFSCKTWTISGTTWSDYTALRPADCNPDLPWSSTVSNGVKTYKVYTPTGRPYYNINCVDANRAALCPTPWRLGNYNESIAVVNYLTYGQAIGFGFIGVGYFNKEPNSFVIGDNQYYWWVINNMSDGVNLSALEFNGASGVGWVKPFRDDFGRTVRCAK
jgi:hypothetical protein